MAANGPSERNLETGIRLILEELRDLRVEIRADRRHADEDRKRADDERRRADARFERIVGDFKGAFRDIRAVGLSIVKTLNQHTRLLQRIDQKLGALGNGRPGPGNGGRARPGK